MTATEIITSVVSRRSPIWLASVSALIVCVVGLLLFGDSIHGLDYRSVATDLGTKTQAMAAKAAGKTTTKSSIYNSTLGFERVMAINLDYRWDRADTLALQAANTGINITIVKGVMPAANYLKGVPYKADILESTHIGCSRAHANIWRQMVQENLGSVLILESDADWDVNMADQLSLVADHLPGLIDTMHPEKSMTHEKSAHDPYSTQNWDILVLGTCFEYGRPDKNFVSWYDKDMTPMSWVAQNMKELLVYYYNVEFWAEILQWPETKYRRFLHKTIRSVCTTGYALSQRGASRLLFNLASQGYTDPVDLQIASLTESGLLDGYTVLPPLVGSWRYDNEGYNTDIQGVHPDLVPVEARSPEHKKSRRAAGELEGRAGGVLVPEHPHWISGFKKSALLTSGDRLYV